MTKKTLVLGASLKPERYSNIAINMLLEFKHEIVAFGLRKGFVNNVEIITDLEHKSIRDIHTVTLYLNAKRQKEYYAFLINLKPVRVIFNPGTQNKELENLLHENRINTEDACTLVLLRTDQY